MTFWGGSGSGSGSADPCLLLMDPNTNFSAYYFLKVHLHHFSKIKSQKGSQNSGNQGFSYYICMLKEGSGSGSGSIPLTGGSGSGKPKKHVDPVDPDPDPDPQHWKKVISKKKGEKRAKSKKA
jgi:hypothetical protein